MTDLDPQIVEAVSAAIGALAVGGTIIWKAVGGVRRFVHLVDDLAGTPERKGVPAQPGIVERIKGVETAQANLTTTQTAHTLQLNELAVETAEQSRMLKAVSHEVHFNNGSSVKDSTTRTEAALKAVADDVSDIKRRLAELPPPPKEGPEE